MMSTRASETCEETTERREQGRVYKERNELISKGMPYQLRRGFALHYGKFLQNLLTLLHPLKTLLKDDKSWDWTQECEKAFIAAKKLLTAPPVLVHYGPSLPIQMAGDASAYGIGAVISHILPNGQERPIAYASCSTLCQRA